MLRKLQLALRVRCLICCPENYVKPRLTVQISLLDLCKSICVLGIVIRRWQAVWFAHCFLLEHGKCLLPYLFLILQCHSGSEFGVFLSSNLNFSQMEFLVYQSISKLRVEVYPCTESVPSCRQMHGIKETASEGDHNFPAQCTYLQVVA